MREKFNTSAWKPEQYRIHCGNRDSEIQGKIEAADARIAELVGQTFATDAGRSTTLQLARGTRRTMHELTEILDKYPGKHGRLTREANEVIPGLVREIGRKADLLASREEYDRLQTMTFEANKSPQALREQYDYCEANLETRDLRYDGPGGPDDPQSMGAMKVRAAELNSGRPPSDLGKDRPASEGRDAAPASGDRKVIAEQRNKLLEAGRQAEAERRRARELTRKTQERDLPDPDLGGR